MQPEPAIEPDAAARLTQCVARFARAEIASRPDLRAHAVVPPGLWHAMGEAGLARIGLPAAYGGDGGGLPALAAAAETLAAAGGVKGMVTCWLARQLVALLQIAAHGSDRQRDAWLPAIAAGKLTPALAISEPGAGAHPKHLVTAARRDGGDYVIDGEKAYVTNGPVADLFLVLAVSAVENGRKQFSMLAVPAEAPGLERTAGVPIDFLRPAPHCGLALRSVRVPAANVLGPPGEAFAAMSVPMRQAEDALAAASCAGSMRHQLARLAAELAAAGDPDEATLETLGRLAAVPDGLSALAARAVDLLDTEREAAASIAAAARDWTAAAQADLQALIARTGLSPSAMLAAETRDIEKSLGIARAAHSIRAHRRARALFASALVVPQGTSQERTAP